jgi:hypothetical protein
MQMRITLLLLSANAVLINGGFLLAFLIRYGTAFPESNFLPYKNSFIFLTVIYISALSFFRVYKARFRSSWDLFRRILSGIFLGTLLNIVFVYVFRSRWSAFPTSVFALSFFINLLLILKLNQYAPVKRQWDHYEYLPILIDSKYLHSQTLDSHFTLSNAIIPLLNRLLRFP